MKLFYTQERVGKDGKVFTMYKLRTMIKDAEKEGPQFTTCPDNRITKVGSFLRKTRLDELPQFINVLKGEMNLIGPRPERPEFVKVFMERNPDYRLRLAVKPGITGWAQVMYKYTDNIEDGLVKLQYDLTWIQNRCLLMDLKILWKTLIIVLTKKGT